MFRNSVYAIFAFLPVYFFILASKLMGSLSYSVTDILVHQPCTMMVGAFFFYGFGVRKLNVDLTLIGMGSVLKTSNIILIFFLVCLQVVVQGLLHLVTLYYWNHDPPPPDGLSTSIQTISSSIALSLIWIVVMLVTQIYLEITKAYLFLFIWRIVPGRLGALCSILLLSFVFGLVNIDHGLISILNGTLFTTIFAVALYSRRSISVLIISSILFQLLNVIPIWIP